MTAHSRKYSVQYAFERIPDAALFASFTIGGMIAIFALRWFQLPTLVPACTAGGLISTYGMTVWLSKRYRLRNDRAADNCYYMGLLFTFIALSYSLYAVIELEKKSEIVIADLGIALSSTICGLLWRVLLSQLREDPVEVEDAVRLELGDSARKVRSQLNDIVLEFQIFSNGLKQIFSETGENMARDLTESVEKSASTFINSSKSVLEKVDEAFEAFGENTKKLNGQARRTSNAMEKMVAKIEALQVPGDLLVEKFSPLLEKISASGERMLELETRHIASIESVNEALFSVREEGGRLSGSLAGRDGALNVLPRFAEQIASVADSAGRARDELDSVVSQHRVAMAALQEQQAVSVEQMQKSRGDIKSATDDLSQSFRDMAAAMREAFPPITDGND